MLHFTTHFPVFLKDNQPTLAFSLGLSAGFFLLTMGGFAQTRPIPDTTVYTVVEKQPEFPGGFNALKEYMHKTVQYPSEAQKAGIKGRVFASFVVEPDSNITNIQLLKGLGYGCDEEAIRVISAMPRWAPGSQSGRLLRVKHILPVLFGIDYPKVKVR